MALLQTRRTARIRYVGRENELKARCRLLIATAGNSVCEAPSRRTIDGMRLLRKTSVTLLLLGYLVLHPSAFREAFVATVRWWREGGLASIKARLLEYLKSHVAYALWVEKHDTLKEADRGTIQRHIGTLSGAPVVFSILIPAKGADQTWLRRSVQSVVAQLYPHWEVLLAGVGNEGVPLEDARIAAVTCKSDEPVHHILSLALERARGEFVLFLEPDTLLAEHALYAMAREIRRDSAIEVLYSDNDQIDRLGRRVDPHFKPDWSPDLLLGWNYVRYLAAYRTTTVRAVGGIRSSSGGDWHWDVALRVTENLSGSHVRHTPHILCHRLLHDVVRASDSIPTEDGRAVVTECLRRLGCKADVIRTECGGFRVQYALPEPVPRVSIIVPTRNGLHLLKHCVESIFRLTDYENYEVIVVDNQSDDPAALAYLDHLRRFPRSRVLSYDAPYNFADIMNFAAKSVDGALLCFLNNDTEVISRGWLGELAGHSVRPEVGAVGAMLYFPDETIQHAGVVLGIGQGHIAGHLHLGAERGSPGYFGRLALAQNVSAVTAACMTMRKSVFEEVGGMDAVNLPVDFNDVDLCLRIRERGYRVVWTPFAELYHHESATRGRGVSRDNRARFRKEADFMRARWRHWLDNDPAFNSNLSREYSRPFVALPARVEKPWRTSDDHLE